MAERPGEESSSGGRIGPAAAGIAAFAIVCCAGFTLIAGGALGGIAIGAVFGVGAGLLATAVLVTLVVIWAQRRRKRACEAPERDEAPERESLSAPATRAP